MDLKNILSISGKPGLYNLLSTNASTIIVESLSDGKRIPVHAAHKISSLADISIYTIEEDLPLEEVFEMIYVKENGGPCISHNSDAAELRKYMVEVLPDYDAERVYNSDLKKLFQWYNTLHGMDMLDFNLDAPTAEAPAETADSSAEKEEG